MRVCYGEFDFQGSRSGRTARLQNEFLRAIHIHKPEVWKDLFHLRNLSTLTRTGLTWRQISGKQPLRVRRKVLLNVDPQDPLWKQLSNPQAYLAAASAALTEWSCRWNLNAEWCLQRAYDALRWWTRHGKVDSVLWTAAHWGGTVTISPQPLAPPNGLPEYVPLFTFREDYLKSIRASRARHGLLKIAGAYCEKVERSYEGAGYSRCRNDEKRKLDQHLEWTVRFQVRGESLDDIVATGDIEKSTVFRGVNDMLRLIDLEKRADAKRGRRVGSRNKESKVTRRIRRELGH